MSLYDRYYQVRVRVNDMCVNFVNGGTGTVSSDKLVKMFEYQA